MSIIASMADVVEHNRHCFEEPPEKLIQRSMEGDIEAVEELYCHANERDRAELMVQMFVYRAPSETLRTMLMRVWDHEHRHLLQAVGIRMVKEIFRRADFPPPEGVPDTLTVYRGGFGITQRKLAAGLSWTTDRDIACFFAMRHVIHSGATDPMLLKATIRRDEIRMMEPDHRESEVVIFGARGSAIDGDPSEWADRCRRYMNEKDRRFWAMSEAA